MSQRLCTSSRWWGPPLQLSQPQANTHRNASFKASCLSVCFVSRLVSTFGQTPRHAADLPLLLMLMRLMLMLML
jgi:hypothetical protein